MRQHRKAVCGLHLIPCVIWAKRSQASRKADGEGGSDSHEHDASDKTSSTGLSRAANDRVKRRRSQVAVIVVRPH